MKTVLTLLLAFLAVAHASAADTQPTPAPQRVLLLLGKTYNVGEFHAAYFALRAAGYPVDIATNEPADIEAGSKDRSLDIPQQHTISLANVNAANYIALVIPGGSSPENLEKDPRSILICQQFHKAQKPIAAICHGPRLLMRAGITKNKNITSLFTLKDEAPELWNPATFKNYLDQPLVTHDNLLTSRYPNDAQLFGTQIIQHLHNFGGRYQPAAPANVAVLYHALDPKARQERWAYTAALTMINLQSTLITSPEEAAKLADIQNLDALLIVNSADNPAYTNLQKQFQNAGKKILTTATPDRSTSAKWIAIGNDLADLSAALTRKPLAANTTQATQPATNPKPAQPSADASKDPLDVAIVLAPGFDPLAVQSLLRTFSEKEKSVALLAEKKGDVLALDGSTLSASAAYTDPLTWKNNAPPLLIAPGFLSPDSLNKESRLARLQWLATQHKNGATLVAIGFDSFYLARDGQLENSAQMKFATSDQCVWSFQKDFGAYSPDPIRKTAPRLYTLKNSGTIPDLLKLLAEN